MEENWSVQLKLAKFKEEELQRNIKLARLVRESPNRANNTNIIPFHYPVILRLAKFIKELGVKLEVKYEKKLKQRAYA